MSGLSALTGGMSSSRFGVGLDDSNSRFDSEFDCMSFTQQQSGVLCDEDSLRETAAGGAGQAAGGYDGGEQSSCGGGTCSTNHYTTGATASKKGSERR